MSKYRVIYYLVGDDRVVSSVRQVEEVIASSPAEAEKIISIKHKNIWISKIYSKWETNVGFSSGNL